MGAERRLQRKLDEWVGAGMISAEQATAIRAWEAAPKPGLPWGVLIFAGFGAVILGLGVILLFAYNWEKMHRFAKLGVVFGALALAHGLGLWLRRREKAAGFAESALLLGTMLFGAGIWLVAQTYHISAHFPNAFFVWAAGALLLAWALPSMAQGLVAAALLAIWSCTEAGAFDTHLAVAPLLVLAGVGWLAWRLRSPVLLAAAAVSFSVSATAGVSVDGSTVFPVLLGVAVLLAATAWLARESTAFPSAQVVLAVCGVCLYLPLLFILSFRQAAEALMGVHRSWRWQAFSVSDWVPVIALPLLALGLGLYATVRAADRRELATPEYRGRLAAPAVTLVLLLALWWPLRLERSLLASDTAGLIAAAVANLLLAYFVVASLWVGCREARLGRVVFGSLLMAAWVLARFSDLFDSLLARGVMFVAMGGALFAVAVLYHRQKHRAAPAPVPAAGVAAPGKEG